MYVIVPSRFLRFEYYLCRHYHCAPLQQKRLTQLKLSATNWHHLDTSAKLSVNWQFCGTYGVTSYGSDWRSRTGNRGLEFVWYLRLLVVFCLLYMCTSRCFHSWMRKALFCVASVWVIYCWLSICRGWKREKVCNARVTVSELIYHAMRCDVIPCNANHFTIKS